jgi:FtsP/CotA-like multicopper oxidase with cupredoxin domain
MARPENKLSLGFCHLLHYMAAGMFREVVVA